MHLHILQADDRCLAITNLEQIKKEYKHRQNKSYCLFFIQFPNNIFSLFMANLIAIIHKSEFRECH